MGDADYTEDVPVQNFDRKRHANSGGSYDGKEAKKARGFKKPTLKFLVPHICVGKLIGKGGSNINELEKKHNGSIEVSPSGDNFPGTNSRIVTISAEIDQVQLFAQYLVENVWQEGADSSGYEPDFVLVITNSAVGFVMGRAGATIKVIQEGSGAGINIQKQNESLSYGERLVTISGSTEQKARAVKEIIEKISCEPLRMSNPYTKGYPSGGGGGNYYPPQYGGSGNDYPPPPRNGRGGYNPNMPPNARHNVPRNSGYNSNSYSSSQNEYGYSNTAGGHGGYVSSDYYQPESTVKTSHLIQMEIPNAWVGSVVGKQGVTINEFSRNSGAQISFSAKEEFAPGTQDRILTIKGTKNQIYTAYTMVDRKVAEIEREFSGY